MPSSEAEMSRRRFVETSTVAAALSSLKTEGLFASDKQPNVVGGSNLLEIYMPVLLALDGPLDGAETTLFMGKNDPRIVQVEVEDWTVQAIGTKDADGMPESVETLAFMNLDDPSLRMAIEYKGDKPWKVKIHGKEEFEI